MTLEKSNDRQVGNTFATQLDVLPRNSHSFRLAASRNVERNRHWRGDRLSRSREECSDAESSIDLYVSPAGDDAWSGRRTDPTGDGGDGPFATLEAARRCGCAPEGTRVKRNP